MADYPSVNVDYKRYLGYTLEKLAAPGLLLAARGTDGRLANAMTIGWATFGIIWGLPICAVLVRPSRYTYGLIEKCQDFTVNVPADGMEQAVSYIGTTSGRNHDKLAEMKLSLIPATIVSTPVIAECTVRYECKVVHWNDVVADNLAPAVKSGSYPHGDFHRVYFGQIMSTTAHVNLDSLLPMR